jgi:hypothetical protein
VETSSEEEDEEDVVETFATKAVTVSLFLHVTHSVLEQ